MSPVSGCTHASVGRLNMPCEPPMGQRGGIGGSCWRRPPHPGALGAALERLADGGGHLSLRHGGGCTSTMLLEWPRRQWLSWVCLELYRHLSLTESFRTLPSGRIIISRLPFLSHYKIGTGCISAFCRCNSCGGLLWASPGLIGTLVTTLARSSTSQRLSSWSIEIECALQCRRRRRRTPRT